MVDATVTMVAGLHVRSCLIWQNEQKKKKKRMKWREKRNKGAELERSSCWHSWWRSKRRGQSWEHIDWQINASFPPFKHKRRV